jgi:photosystem II stability/assembly factor-like uncharacterized protein
MSIKFNRLVLYIYLYIIIAFNICTNNNLNNNDTSNQNPTEPNDSSEETQETSEIQTYTLTGTIDLDSVASSVITRTDILTRSDISTSAFFKNSSQATAINGEDIFVYLTAFNLDGTKIVKSEASSIDGAINLNLLEDTYFLVLSVLGDDNKDILIDILSFTIEESGAIIFMKTISTKAVYITQNIDLGRITVQDGKASTEKIPICTITSQNIGVLECVDGEPAKEPSTTETTLSPDAITEEAVTTITSALPSVLISQPKNLMLFTINDNIFFNASVTSPDTNLKYKWTSSIDGDLSSELSFKKILTKGTHTITLEVTDSANNIVSDSRTIIVKEILWEAVGLSSFALNHIKIDAKNSNIIYVSASENDVNELYKSRDRGATWLKLTQDISSSITSFVIDPDDSNTIFCGTSSGELYKSSDRGLAWTKISTLTKDLRLSIGSDFLIVNELDGKIYKSTDSGVTLTKILNSATNVTIHQSENNYIYATVSNLGRIFKSTDSGANWGSVVLDGVQFIDFDIRDSKKLYAQTENGIFKSTNYGYTWSSTNGDQANPNNAIIVFGAKSEFEMLKVGRENTNNVFAIQGNDTDGYKFYVSRDQASSWTKVDSSNYILREIEPDSNDNATVYVTTQNSGLIRLTLDSLDLDSDGVIDKQDSNPTDALAQ